MGRLWIKTGAFISSYKWHKRNAYGVQPCNPLGVKAVTLGISLVVVAGMSDESEEKEFLAALVNCENDPTTPISPIPFDVEVTHVEPIFVYQPHETLEADVHSLYESDQGNSFLFSSPESWKTWSLNLLLLTCCLSKYFRFSVHMKLWDCPPQWRSETRAETAQWEKMRSARAQ